MNIANTPDADPGPAGDPRAGVMARAYPRGTHIGLHAHGEAQLLFAARGIMQVTTPKGRWFVPPARAVWLPPRVPHAVDVLADIEMRALLIPGARLRAHPEAERLNREFVAVVGPLLRQAILGAFAPQAHPRLGALLAEVAMFQLAEARDAGTFMPLPEDPRARRVAELILADPASGRELADYARLCGASARTLSRLFPAQTDLTFKAWRQRARIMAALELLGASRVSVKQVAARLRFSSVAAFSHAFRQVTGMPPGEFRPAPDAAA